MKKKLLLPLFLLLPTMMAFKPYEEPIKDKGNPNTYITIEHKGPELYNDFEIQNLSLLSQINSTYTYSFDVKNTGEKEMVLTELVNYDLMTTAIRFSPKSYTSDDRGGFLEVDVSSSLFECAMLAPGETRSMKATSNVNITDVNLFNWYAPVYAEESRNNFRVANLTEVDIEDHIYRYDIFYYDDFIDAVITIEYDGNTYKMPLLADNNYLFKASETLDISKVTVKDAKFYYNTDIYNYVKTSTNTHIRDGVNATLNVATAVVVGIVIATIAFVIIVPAAIIVSVIISANKRKKKDKK